MCVRMIPYTYRYVYIIELEIKTKIYNTSVYASHRQNLIQMTINQCKADFESYRLVETITYRHIV